MLYLVTINDNDLTWHVGNKIPNIELCELMEIQADGHELEFIKKNAPKLVEFAPGERILSWYSGDARALYIALRKAQDPTNPVESGYTEEHEFELS